jgi:hypothetical protein
MNLRKQLQADQIQNNSDQTYPVKPVH